MKFIGRKFELRQLREWFGASSSLTAASFIEQGDVSDFRARHLSDVDARIAPAGTASVLWGKLAAAAVIGTAMLGVDVMAQPLVVPAPRQTLAKTAAVTAVDSTLIRVIKDTSVANTQASIDAIKTSSETSDHGYYDTYVWSWNSDPRIDVKKTLPLAFVWMHNPGAFPLLFQAADTTTPLTLRWRVLFSMGMLARVSDLEGHMKDYDRQKVKDTLFWSLKNDPDVNCRISSAKSLGDMGYSWAEDDDIRTALQAAAAKPGEHPDVIMIATNSINDTRIKTAPDSVSVVRVKTALAVSNVIVKSKGLDFDFAIPDGTGAVDIHIYTIKGELVCRLLNRTTSFSYRLQSHMAGQKLIVKVRESKTGAVKSQLISPLSANQ